MDKIKYANAFATIGLVGGILYAMKKNKGLGLTALYGIGLGLAGMFIGNQIQKSDLL
jgi:hypothetical protein